MTSEAGTHFASGRPLPLPRSRQDARHASHREPEERLDRLHSYFLEGCAEELRPVLEAVLGDARSVLNGYGDD